MLRSLVKKASLLTTALVVAASTGVFTLTGLWTNAAKAEVVCTITEKLENTCRPWLGAAAGSYPNVGGAGAQMLAHEQRIGRQVDIAHMYTAPGLHVLDDDVVAFATRPNTIMSVTWQPAQRWADANGTDATTNANIDRMADSILALGSNKVMLTLHHEPENDVSGGGEGCAANKTWVGNAGTPAEYRQMWHTTRERFDAKGVTNVVWVMNYMGYSGWDCIVDDLWPGNDLVDWVKYDPYGEKVGWDDLVGRFYNYLERTSNATHDYKSKIWGLAEFGSWHNATQEHAYQLYQGAKAAVETNRFPRLKAISVFDFGKTNRIAYDRDGNYDATELAYYRAYAQSAAFSNPTAPPVDEPQPDTQAPTVPTNLVATAGSRQIALTWTAATDNTGIAGYYLVRDGARIATLPATAVSYTNTGLTTGKRYYYQLRAFDAAGNRSDVATANARAN